MKRLSLRASSGAQEIRSNRYCERRISADPYWSKPAVLVLPQLGTRWRSYRRQNPLLLNRRNFGVPDPILEDAYTGFTVGSYQNPGFNAGGSRTLRFGMRFIF